jgi:hypothetical protein
METPMVYNTQEFLPSVFGRWRTPASNSPASKPGILRRIIQAMFEWRQAQADREIARFLARSGGRLTDDIERPRNDAFGAIGDIHDMKMSYRVLLRAVAAMNANAARMIASPAGGRVASTGSILALPWRTNMQTLVSSADWRALRELGERAQMALIVASASAEQADCRQRIRAGDLPAFSDGIHCTAVTAELMEYYRRQAHVMQNAGPLAVADLIEHYRRQAHAMRSAEMGTAILQIAHWLLSGLRRHLSEERQQNGARSNVFACESDE